MPARKQQQPNMKSNAPSSKHSDSQGTGKPASTEKVVITESLRATESEKHATSKSLYGDSAARISGNVCHLYDRVRHRAYEAVLRHVRGKTVLHLGCGMGLYSMLAARGLAEHVVAMDTSAIVDSARVVAEENHLTNITFLRGRLCDVLAQLPRKSFDVVLCEWMGAFLLNDPLLDDVLYARDHLLKPGGLLCPNRSSLHVVGVSDYAFRLDTVDFWSNVYGFSMNPMKQLVEQEVEVCSIPAQNIATHTCLMHTVELEALPGLTDEETKRYVEAAEKAESDRLGAVENPVEARRVPSSVAQAGFETTFKIRATHKTTIHFLTFYTDATFTNHAEPGLNFVIGIRPGGQSGWTEVSIGLRDPLPVEADEFVTGTVKVYMPNDRNGRVNVVEVTAKTEGKVASISTTGSYCYQSY